MSEEIKKEAEITVAQAETKKSNENVGVFKKTWGYIVTGITCIAVSVGVMLGADVNKVQETLTKAQAQQVAIMAATYSAEQILKKVTDVAGSESKAQAIKDVVAQVVVSMPEFIEAVNAVKTTAKDTVTIVKDTKAKVSETKKTEAKKIETKTATDKEATKTNETKK